MNTAAPAPARSASASMIVSRIALIAGAGFVLAYFIHFNLPGLRGGFNSDDPMNIYGSWYNGPWLLAKNVALFFSTYYRPMGGVFYSILYHYFGLNPFPYHVAITALLFANTWLAYRFGALLSGSRLIGGFCALLVAYHAGVAYLVFLPSFIYDILCFTFYFLALTYYVSIRVRGAAPGVKRTAVFLLLYIAALESKEMAVSLPVMIVLYEAIWNPPERWRFRAIRQWLRGPALPGLIAGMITAVYIVEKNVGPDALSRIDAYQPVFTWSRFVGENTKYLNELFYQPAQNGFFTPNRTLLLWALMFYIAWRRRDKGLLWAAAFVVIAPLPIAFLTNRGGACLYIPLAAWSLIAATLYVAVAGLIAKEPPLRRIPRAAVIVVLAALGAALVWHETARKNRDIAQVMSLAGVKTWRVVEQFRALQPTIPPRSTVVIMNDVFDTWDTLFISSLVWHDRSVQVWLQHKSNLPQSDIDRMDYIFTFEGDKLVRLKPK